MYKYLFIYIYLFVIDLLCFLRARMQYETMTRYMPIYALEFIYSGSTGDAAVFEPCGTPSACCQSRAQIRSNPSKRWLLLRFQMVGINQQTYDFCANPQIYIYTYK